MSGAGRDPYRRVAAIYDATVGRLNAGIHDAVLRFHPARAGWRVLDVGCGTGAALERYGSAGCDVTGVDVSGAMLARAAQRLGPAADLRLASGTALPFADASFDLVTASMVLHEVPRAERVPMLTEMRRVLDPGGAILLTDFRFGSLRGWRGPAIKLLSYAVESVAGHFSGFRSFRADGGVPALLEQAGIGAFTEKILAGGNMASYLARGPR